jgi:tetratricopeptide (TPR) repeat protein
MKKRAPERKPARPDLLRRLLPLAALVALVALAYSNSFRGLLIYDNNEVILKDTRVRAATAENVHAILTQPYWQKSTSGLYRPLATLSYLFNYAVLENGGAPDGYHWINLSLHLLNVGLVYALGLVIFEQVPAAWLLAALWGVHPVLTESVTNVIGRADLLAAFGVLAGLYCHRRASTFEGVRRAAWLAGLMLASAIGIFSKESAIVLIAVLVLHDLAYGTTSGWRVRAAGYAAAVIPAAIYLGVRTEVLGHALTAPMPFTENPLVGAGFWTARITALKVIGRFLWLWLWPVRLSYDYSYNEIPLGGWTAIPAVLVCAGLAAAAIWCWRRNRAISFGIAFFFIAISPTSNLVILIGSIMGERFLYLPSIGLAILAVCALNRLGEAKTRQAVAAVLLIALAARTWARNADWADEHRFWYSGVEAAPGSYRTHVVAAFQSLPLTPENRDRAIADADRALAILDPLPDADKSGEAYRDLGTFYRVVGDSAPDREHWYRKSLEALLSAEKAEQARDEIYRRWNAGRGLFVSSALYLELGRTYQRLSDPQHALAALEHGRALASEPDLLEELGSIYEASSQWHKAAMTLIEALAVDAKRTHLNGKLVDLYEKTDPQGCSISREGGQRSLNVDCPLVHGDICTASRNVAVTYDRSGMASEAVFIRGVAQRDLGCAAEALR